MNNYKITISEPWDFESPDGENVILGKVIDIVNSKILVFKSNYSLSLKGVVGDILILIPRFPEGNFNDLDKRSDSIEVNGAILFIEYSNSINNEELKENSEFAIIGSIKAKGFFD